MICATPPARATHGRTSSQSEGWVNLASCYMIMPDPSMMIEPARDGREDRRTTFIARASDGQARAKHHSTHQLFKRVDLLQASSLAS